MLWTCNNMLGLEYKMYITDPDVSTAAVMCIYSCHFPPCISAECIQVCRTEQIFESCVCRQRMLGRASGRIPLWVFSSFGCWRPLLGDQAFPHASVNQPQGPSYKTYQQPRHCKANIPQVALSWNQILAAP